MRPEPEYREAVRLIRSGMNDSAIGRELGIPRETVRDWRRGIESGSGGRTMSFTGRTGGTGRRRPGPACPLCSEDGSLDEEAYAYLLGVYLGDGCLSLHPRGVYRLRISCDLKYPEIINEIATHIVIVSGSETVGFTPRQGCVEVSSYWKHWICLFPQHGPGPKHERAIVLEPWQQRIVTDHPKALIRGLIHSDGNRHMNRVKRRFADGIRSYSYPRYMFTNASEGIRKIFTDTLDLLEIHWTKTTTRIVAVSRKPDVDALDAFVGPKH